jgi:hypothetical protein
VATALGADARSTDRPERLRSLGAGADRSRIVLAPAVPGHHPSGLAPADAHPDAGLLSPHGMVRLAAAGAPPTAFGPAAGREGEAFTNAAGRVECTLVASWTEGPAEPWLLVTDLAPARVSAAWYERRGWIEQGFKRLKRVSWDCERTRLRDARRVERPWLAVAVAPLGTVSARGQAEARRPRKPRRPRPRCWRPGRRHRPIDRRSARSPKARPRRARPLGPSACSGGDRSSSAKR